MKATKKMQNVTVTSVISTTPTASEQSTTGTRQTTVEMNINVPYKKEQITSTITVSITHVHCTFAGATIKYQCIH